MLGSTPRVGPTTPPLLGLQVPSLQPIPHHQQVGLGGLGGVVWKVMMRSRLPRDQLAMSERQLLPRHRLDPASGREAAGRRTSPCRAAARGRS